MIWFLSWSCERLRASNKSRLPPLQGRTLLEVCEWSPKGDNQGGTANVNSSLRSVGLRDFFVDPALQISVYRSGLLEICRPVGATAAAGRMASPGEKLAQKWVSRPIFVTDVECGQKAA